MTNVCILFGFQAKIFGFDLCNNVITQTIFTDTGGVLIFFFLRQMNKIW